MGEFVISKTNINLSTALGATFAWYDFIIFNIAIAIVFPKLFFPEMGALLPILAFAVGFAARPLGSVVFGIIGDRLGRKVSLVSTLLLTGVSTVCIGLLPTHDQIGITATILLVLARIMQTAAVGGEWAAASTLVVEHNHDSKKKSLISSFVNNGFAIGSIGASLMFFFMLSFGNEFFMSIGWRIPFLLSGILLIIGVYMRLRLLETPAFLDNQKKSEIDSNPLRTVFAKHYKIITLAALAVCLAPTWAYGIMVFASSYMVQSGLISRPDLTQAQLIAWCVIFLAQTTAGWLGDKVDRLKLFTAAGWASVVLVYPMFQLVAQGQALFAMLMLSFLIFNLALTSIIFCELFPSEIRQTGAGVSYNLGLVLSGVAIIAAQHILTTTQNITNVAHLFAALTVVALASIYYLKRQLSQQS
jgi:MFS family permease